MSGGTRRRATSQSWSALSSLRHRDRRQPVAVRQTQRRCVYEAPRRLYDWRLGATLRSLALYLASHHRRELLFTANTGKLRARAWETCGLLPPNRHRRQRVSNRVLRYCVICASCFYITYGQDNSPQWPITTVAISLMPSHKRWRGKLRTRRWPE